MPERIFSFKRFFDQDEQDLFSKLLVQYNGDIDPADNLIFLRLAVLRAAKAKCAQPGEPCHSSIAEIEGAIREIETIAQDPALQRRNPLFEARLDCFLRKFADCRTKLPLARAI